MNKYLMALIIFLSLLLTACNLNSNNNVEKTSKESQPVINVVTSNSTNTNEDIKITTVDSKDIRVEAIKAAGISFPLIFDVEVNNILLEGIELSVDYYVDGLFESTVTSMMTHTDGASPISLYVTNNTLNKAETKWVLSVVTKDNGNGGGRGSSEVVHTSKDYDFYVHSWLHDIKATVDEEIILGYVAGNINGLSTKLEDNLIANSELYVVKCKFVRKKDT